MSAGITRISLRRVHATRVTPRPLHRVRITVRRVTARTMTAAPTSGQGGGPG